MRWAVAILAVCTGFQLSVAAPQQQLKGARPNIVFILADDLGYGDLGCYGQKLIHTPSLDRMAAEGLRFSQCYAGSTVCAPSRCVLMTGLHTGHARIRGNDKSVLLPTDATVASVLQQAGYDTALIGKWGLGDLPGDSIPTRRGFNEFFGYLNNHHAHNYYPEFLWRNEAKQRLEGNVESAGVSSVKKTYSHDLLTEAALEYVARRRTKPFFLYLAYTIPHANNEAGNKLGNGMEIPELGEYADKPWPEPEKGRAAMISRLDRDVGRLLEKLKVAGIEGNTIVFFTSDNGPHREGKSNPDFFKSASPFRGIKRDLYEGGIRVPLLVRWPTKWKAGELRKFPCGFWDVLPTLADLAGAKTPPGLDGISLVPALANGKVERGEFRFYWEFHERGFSQAMLTNVWKASRLGGVDADIDLYNLRSDPGETKSRSPRHPEIVDEFDAAFAAARTDDPRYPARKLADAKKQGRTAKKTN